MKAKEKTVSTGNFTNEFDRRLDIFAEFFLDRCIEKIRQDRAKKLLQERGNGGIVKV